MGSQNTNIESIYPLSPMQQGMLFETLRAPAAGMYSVQRVITLGGRLQPRAMREAWERVAQRHPPLRTLFVWKNTEKPLQVVRQRVELPWQYEDWCTLPAAAQQAKVEELLLADRQESFDLSRAPLMRLRLIRLSEERHALVWHLHHLLLDGWSGYLVLDEVMRVYQGLCDGGSLPLESRRPYLEYIRWLQQQDMGKAKEFWREALSGFTTPTPFGVDRRSKDQSDSPRGVQDQSLEFRAGTTDRMRTFCKNQNLTLGTLLQAAWALLLSRYSGEDDVLFGTVVSGRPAELAGAESMVGMFINTLPVRARLPADASASLWLKSFQRQLAEMRQYEYSPLVEVQGCSEVARGLPLFDSLFDFVNYPVDPSLRQTRGGLNVTNIRGIERTNFPLTFTVLAREKLIVRASYDAGRFDTDAIARMLGHYQKLLESTVGNPEQRLRDLELLTDAERRQVLAHWNQTELPYARDKCLHHLVEEQVERAPGRVAAVCQERRLTYRELNAQANRLARRLQILGVGPDTLVGICAERSLDMVVGLLGVLKAGGAYVPLDPNYPKERLQFMLEDARPVAVLTQRKLETILPPHAAKVVYLDALDERNSDQEQTLNCESEARADGLAYVLYTSGSTGRPKGVALEHRNAVAFATWARSVFSDEEFSGVLFSTSICFDLSVFELFVTLTSGGKVILAQNILELPTLPAANEVKLINTVPSAVAELVDSGGIPRSATTLNLAGEPLSQSLVDKLYETSGVQRVYDLYGPTEATTYSTFTLRQRGGKATIGCPISNTQVYILDAHRHPVPVGVPGELYLGGEGLARGYLNRPELTQERFVPNPFVDRPGARLYKTGDRARFLSDGTIEYLGRLDHQIKLRGFRIELGEIEAVLRGHPGVREAVVVVRDDVPGDKRLLAYVVSRNGAVSTAELQQCVRARLPDYMMPSAFVSLEAIPLTPNGKVDRKALPEPEPEQVGLDHGFVAPRTPLEAALAGIWCEVLGRNQVGVHDDFFALGGHSLLASRIISRTSRALGIDTPLQLLFDNPTVAEMAGVVENQYLDTLNSHNLNQIAREIQNLTGTQAQGPLERSGPK